ncbi:MAG TPA: PAS domain S-box protein [Anaerolineae bacterium]|nr:PAS domain S-box protein [Anaerolineae bacterium]
MAEKIQPGPDLTREHSLQRAERLGEMLASDGVFLGIENRGTAEWSRHDAFRALAENAPDMIARMDRDQRYIYVNPAIEEMTGLPAHTFLGKNNRDLKIDDDLGNLWERQVSAVLVTGEKRQFAFSALAVGEERHYDARLAPEFGPEGEVESVLAIVRDVTERERTQRTLQRYASRLHFLHEVDEAIRDAQSAEEVAEAALPYAQLLLPCLRASVALYDREAGEVLLLAVRADEETIAGKGHRMPIEWSWFVDELAAGRICHVQDLAAIESRDGVVGFLRSEGAQSLMSVPLIVQDELTGSLNLWMATADPLTPEQQEIAQEMGSHLAIAIQQARLYEQVQRHAEGLEQSVARRTAALQVSQARFLTIFENAAIGIALIDTDGRVVTSNPALQQMLGYSAEELQDMNVDDFIHRDDLSTRDELFRELIAGTRNHFKMERRYVRKDGTAIWVQPTVSVVRTAQGAARYAIKMVEDVTEQRRAREALIQAERLTIAGKIGASLAHEISNPLQSVLGALGLAEEMVSPEDDIHRYLQVAISELRRASGIVAQLRNLNRASEPGERKPVHLSEIIDSIVLLTRRQCQAHNVGVYWDVSPELPEMLVVPDRIRQVFLNILLNAVGAMPTGGQLRIEAVTTHEPDGVRISFADTGGGVDPNLMPHLFEPFRTTKKDGLGLGLYISKTIVEEHGGRIEVESRAGEGTTFCVWLPTAP